MAKKTDVGKIAYPDGLSAADRRHCRKMIVAVGDMLWCDNVIISCSAGIDSTVLVHAVGQSLLIRPYNKYGEAIKATAVYLNHHLRPDEVCAKEAEHVEKMSCDNLSYCTPAIHLDVKKGAGLQERARIARYDALDSLIGQFRKNGTEGSIHIMTAHNMNDVAETKLFQFLKGKKVTGIPETRFLKSQKDFVVRPFLSFSRKDIERYAESFKLTWCEDSSNLSDNYTRNKIRHHLIPWIQENINPSVINTLGVRFTS